MNTGFSAVLSCFYRKYRRWHLCLKQLATAPFFHLKLTPCKVGGTPQVLSWGPEPQPSPGTSCGVPRGGMGLSFLCPPPAVHCPAPRGSPECPRPTSSSASFPKFPSAKAPPSLEARPCSAQDDGYLFKWLPCHLAPRPEVPFSVDRCEQPVCRAGTLVLPPPPGPRTFPASQDRLRLRK